MVYLRLAALAVAIPAVAAIGLQLQEDPCDRYNLTVTTNIVEPYNYPRFYLNEAVPFKFCSTNPHTQMLNVSFTTRDDRGESKAPPQTILVVKNLHTPGVFLKNRYYEANLKLTQGQVPRGEYYLQVDEAYSPNGDDKSLSSTYTTPVAVMN